MDIDKLRKNTVPYNELEEKYMENSEFQKEYLNLSLEEYLTDGDFNTFYKYCQFYLHKKYNTNPPTKDKKNPNIFNPNVPSF